MSHQVITDFLEPDFAARLLSFAIGKEADFVASGVGTEGQVIPTVRRSRKLCDLGPFRAPVQERVLHWVPELIKDLGLTHFDPTDVETEIVAHEDGAFYQRHIDLFTGEERVGQDRLISVVLYLHSQPKQFSGGELRLYPQPLPSFDPKDQNFIDIEPEHGMAVAFSSWMPHEVRPVVCPSTEFRHARFAINCWVIRAKPGVPTQPRGSAA